MRGGINVSSLVGRRKTDLGRNSIHRIRRKLRKDCWSDHYAENLEKTVGQMKALLMPRGQMGLFSFNTALKMISQIFFFRIIQISPKL
jgi:hypothetical protein